MGKDRHHGCLSKGALEKTRYTILASVGRFVEGPRKAEFAVDWTLLEVPPISMIS